MYTYAIKIGNVIATAANATNVSHIFSVICDESGDVFKMEA